jgi:hypothetical protein
MLEWAYTGVPHFDVVIRTGKKYRVIQRPCYTPHRVLVVSEDEELCVLPLSWLFLRLSRFPESALDKGVGGRYRLTPTLQIIALLSFPALARYSPL